MESDPESAVLEQHLPHASEQGEEIGGPMETVGHRRKPGDAGADSLRGTVSEVPEQFSRVSKEEVDPPVGQQRRDQPGDLLVCGIVIAKDARQGIPIDEALLAGPLA